MNVIVVGSGGQVGRALMRACPDAIGLGRADLDLAGDFFLFSATPPPATLENPVVVNVAAFTAVDEAEYPDRQDELFAVNASAPGRLAQQCQAAGVPFIHVSTDYVFDGTLPEGQLNPVDAAVNPVNWYGRTKYAGEVGTVGYGGHVVRTSWVYSGPNEPGRDFVTTMLDLADRGVDPGVVDDQYGRPTSAEVLAGGLLELAEHLAEGQEMPPRLHFAGGGDVTTWYGFAREVFSLAGHDPDRVSPVSTSDYPTRAPRPANTALDLCEWEKVGLTPPPAWQESLAAMLR
ncbi:MAG TPA: NAD(P)-dependent oxidoreductase [Candidatus Corynebacterium gallistercoris]|uniref:dTDP-4-dehydrorhamnose reductase n=1 Tax=Candidatus Corynebacterium gallistercoris TaxID=2838530 RepID=A0A9D1RZF8_9CORY|nr:NAD(P)-dependent oxidoreductase [Candidatus Corynebacterium gallistercoris]